MEAKVKEQENKRKLREMEMEADIAVEDQKKQLIDMQVDNQRKEADSQKYMLESTLEPYKKMDWKTLMAINKDGLNPKLNVAVAFRELAENAEKIGTLNITPDLMESMIQEQRNY